jgi:hypothetical protein
MIHHRRSCRYVSLPRFRARHFNAIVYDFDLGINRHLLSRDDEKKFMELAGKQ